MCVCDLRGLRDDGTRGGCNCTPRRSGGAREEARASAGDVVLRVARVARRRAPRTSRAPSPRSFLRPQDRGPQCGRGQLRQEAEAHSSQVNKRREEGAEGRCALASGRMERFSASSVMRGGGGPGATAYGQTAYLARAKSSSRTSSPSFFLFFYRRCKPIL